ncbi:MAG: phytanoyl-CoA dioxygenase [Rhodospirillaceae bacterium]|nr:phytanoyl-CoA dioxygenase [Rhodospirillaceae bacterium]MBT5664574.1 phytanoyl-CoA dioxygenase [Rhodospirillaceae bacterium]
MELTPEQIAQFEEDGYLIFPELFSPEETAVLKAEAARVSQIDAECIFREGEAQLAKSMFRLHEADGPTASSAYRAASRSPRVLRVAQQVLGDDALYLHHCKVNMKAAIEGTAWPWHQDFGSWRLDGIARPDMATLAVLLDDATEFSGCLHLLPGSHREGRKDPYWDDKTAYKLWAVGPTAMKDMIKRYPDPIRVDGKAGTAAIFHCNLLHASGHNLSAQDRWQAYFCFNTVKNRPADVEQPRPDYVRSRNWTPMETVADDALLASVTVS